MSAWATKECFELRTPTTERLSILPFTGLLANSKGAEKVEELSSRTPVALIGIELMIRWIDNIRFELRHARDAGKSISERELIDSFIQNVPHILGYSEAMVQELWCAIDKLTRVNAK